MPEFGTSLMIGGKPVGNQSKGGAPATTLVIGTN